MALINIVYTEPASTAFANVGWRYYLVFILVPMAGVPLLWQLPETKGLSLEEIAGVFGEEVAQDKPEQVSKNVELDEPSSHHIQDVRSGV